MRWKRERDTERMKNEERQEKEREAKRT
jgi:hypothetical protein